MKHEETRKSLYVATHDYTTLTKVGVAINPTTRLTQLKGATGADLKIYYESPLTTNFLKIETKVLNYFQDKRICGEWINETPEKIIEYIRTIENEFDSIEYTCLSCLFHNYTEEEVKEIAVYNIKDLVPYKSYKLDLYNIYVTEDFRFMVFIQQSNLIFQTSFNVYRTARKFAIEYKARTMKFNIDTGEFINNPKFRIENE